MTILRFFNSTALESNFPAGKRGGYFGWTDRYGLAFKGSVTPTEYRRPYFIANY